MFGSFGGLDFTFFLFVAGHAFGRPSHIGLARGCDIYRSSFPAVAVQAPKVEKRTFVPAVFTQSICSSPTRYLPFGQPQELHGFHRWLRWSASLVLEEPCDSYLPFSRLSTGLNLYIIYTPEDERIEPENDGLVQMFFLLPGVYRVFSGSSRSSSWG